MMEIWFILLMIWAVVTLLGHLSWLILAAFFRLFLPKTENTNPRQLVVENSIDEFAATRRVIHRIFLQRHLSEEQKTQIMDALRRSQYGDPEVESKGVVSRQSSAAQRETKIVPSFEPHQIDPWDIGSLSNTESNLESSVQQTKEPVPVGAEVAAKSLDKVSSTHAESNADSAEIVDAESLHVPKKLFDTDLVADVKNHEPASRDEERETARAPSIKLSISEIIQSFLSSHNIRWGEIVAGILIVVCSIGLVRTLWSTLIDTHPLVPSIIFLAANSAIGAAGLYTLRRWKLRHTSRAVLLIAILLIPLSVLAGIAAVREDVSLVSLGDPVTLGFIAIASGVYCRLAYSYISALTHVAFRVMLTASFVLPVGLLPFGRAAVERFGDHAGWLLMVASLAVLAVAGFLIRARGRTTPRMGRALSRLHLMFVAITVYGCLISAAYLAIRIGETETKNYLPLTLSLIPALMGLGAVANGVRLDARVATHSLTGMISAFMLVSITFILFVPSASSNDWLWVWSGILSSSFLWATYRARQHEWSALVAIPVGLACVFSAQQLTLSGMLHESSLWMRILSGETLVVVLGICIVVAIWLALNRNEERGIWIKRSLKGWVLVALAIASALVILPTTCLGAFPLWGLNVLLALLMGLVLAVAFSVRFGDAKIVVGSCAVASLFWLSFTKPFTWFAVTSVEPFAWAAMFSGITLLLTDFSSRLLSKGRLSTWIKSDSQHSQIRLSFTDGTVLSMVGSCLVLLASAAPIGKVNLLLSFAIGLMLLAAIYSASNQRLFFAQSLSILLTAGLTYQWIPITYFTVDHFVSGGVWWIFSVLFSGIALAWLVIRELVALFASRFDLKIAGPKDLDELDRASARNMIKSTWDRANVKLVSGPHSVEAWAMSLSLLTGCVAVATGYLQSIISLSVVQGHLDFFYFVCGAFAEYLLLGTFLKRYFVNEVWRGGYVIVGSLLLVAQTSCGVASEIFSIHEGRNYLIVVSTSMVFLAGVSYRLITSRLVQPTSEHVVKALRIVEVFSLAIISIVSARFLYADWIVQVSRGENPYQLSMLVVVLWSLLGSVWFRFGDSSFSVSWKRFASVCLFCSAAVIALPFIHAPRFAYFLQLAGLASLLWGMSFLREKLSDEKQAAEPVLPLALGFGFLVGVITSVLTTVRVFFEISHFEVWYGGFLVSLAASIVLVSKLGNHCIGGPSRANKFLVASWPIGVSILAGQIAWLIYLVFPLDEVESRLCVCLVWVVTAIAAYWRDRASEDRLGKAFVVGVAIVAPLITFFFYPDEYYFGFLGLVLIVVSGCLVRRQAARENSVAHATTNQTVAWWVLIGGTLQISHLLIPVMTLWSFSQIFVVWSITWLFIWSNVKGESSRSEITGKPNSAVPCYGILIAVSAISTLDLVSSVFDWFPSIAAFNAVFLPLHLIKLLSIALLPILIVRNLNQRWTWLIALYQSAVVTAFATVSVVGGWQLSSIERLAVAASSIALLNGTFSYWCDSIAIRVCRASCDQAQTISFARDALLRMIALVTSGCGSIVVGLILTNQTPPAIHLLIASVALGGWAIAQCATSRDSGLLRKISIATALLAIAMWASLDLQLEAFSLLKISMRWLVVSAILLPVMTWVLPVMLGRSVSTKWDPPVRWGAGLVCLVGLFSLFVMLTFELTINFELVAINKQSLAELPDAQIFLVGFVIAALAIGSAVLAIGTNARFRLQQRLALSDENRTLAVYASQFLAAVVWLHLYLCRPDWLFVEMRDNWYYIVMALAFVSVGATEIAKRIQDGVLLNAFQRNAFLLPLIPIIGFWTSSYEWLGGGLISQPVIRYDVLLFVGAIYYGLVSHLWRHTWSRVVSVGLGNVAWWFTLTQTPGWAFMDHPQLWLIPPAFCVLFAVSKYRETMDDATVAFIRYAAMLTIYLSSTADMLIQQIGVSLMGPIMLVLLSLLGMVAGVILRVRAFLFLGAAFVLLGTVSMVWHANQSLGSWVWWGFGITTGVLLLVGLTLLEKYKNQLRNYSDRIASWDQ